MRFVTYNIRLGKQQGVEAIADAIRDQEPDVLAIQEVGLNWTMGPEGDTTARLSELLDLPYHEFSHALDENGGQYGHALLSRFPITSSERIELPREVDEPRTMLKSEIEIPDGRLTVISTHLSYIDDRVMQGPLLVEAAMAAAEPVVVMGDLNGEDYEDFVMELQDNFNDADGELRRTTFPSDAPRIRIDYLLARGGSWADVVVGENAEASDHHFVAATLVAPVTSSS